MTWSPSWLRSDYLVDETLDHLNHWALVWSLTELVIIPQYPWIIISKCHYIPGLLSVNYHHWRSAFYHLSFIGIGTSSSHWHLQSWNILKHFFGSFLVAVWRVPMPSWCSRNHVATSLERWLLRVNYPTGGLISGRLGALLKSERWTIHPQAILIYPDSWWFLFILGGIYPTPLYGWWIIQKGHLKRSCLGSRSHNRAPHGKIDRR
jgi:hypothetical protein